MGDGTPLVHRALAARRGPSEECRMQAGDPSLRQDVCFRSGGVSCAAWLYRPASSSEHELPCVVMAQGFGGTREMRLWAYAERFVAAGYAVLAFDYRHFGGSE